jgi:hypothetical protein
MRTCQTDIFRITGKIRQASLQLFSDRKIFCTAQFLKILKKLFKMRETHCGFPSSSQSLKELKRKGARGIQNTLTI